MQHLRSMTYLVYAIVALLFGAPAAQAGEPEYYTIYPDGQPFARAEPGKNHVTQQNGHDAAAATWPSGETGPTGQPVMRVTNTQTAPRPWDAQLVFPIQRNFREGDTGLIAGWFRTVETTSEAGESDATLFVQPAENSTGHQRNPLKLAAIDQWKRIYMPLRFKANAGKGGNVVVHLGARPQTIEFSDLQFLHYGTQRSVHDFPVPPLTYEGRDPDAPWRAAAWDRIEQHRKQDLALRVIDGNGNPVPNATIEVEMTRHAFIWGFAVTSSYLFDDARYFPHERRQRGRFLNHVTLDDAERYRQWVLTNSNGIVPGGAFRPHGWLAGKTQIAEGRDGRFRRHIGYYQPNGKGARFIKEHDLDARGHHIGWGMLEYGVQTKYVRAGDREGLRNHLIGYINEVFPLTESYIKDWDVLNHPVMGPFSNYRTFFGGNEIFAELMAAARNVAGPDVTLTINEGNIIPGGSRREAFLDLLQYLNANGQPPDIVGFMGHFGQASLTPPEEQYRIFETFAEHAPALQLTELDVGVGTRPEDEQLQAEFLRDTILMAFSHPKMVRIVQWGFWEGDHWKADIGAGLLRKNWSMKPAGQAYLDLIHRDFATNVTESTNDIGVLSLRIFKGSYQVTITDPTGPKHVITLDVTDQPVDREITLPAVP